MSDMACHPTARKFIDSQPPDFDVFYGLAITFQYALSSATDLIDLCKAAEISILNKLPASLRQTSRVNLGTGKVGYNISLKEYLDGVRSNGLKAIYQPTRTTRFEIGMQPGSAFGGNTTPCLETVMVTGKPDRLDVFQKHYQRGMSFFLKQSDLELGNRGDGWKPLDDSLLHWEPVEDGSYFDHW